MGVAVGVEVADGIGDGDTLGVAEADAFGVAAGVDPGVLLGLVDTDALDGISDEFAGLAEGEEDTAGEGVGLALPKLPLVEV